MQNIINLITNGVNEFTPSTIIGIIIFVMILDCLGSIAGNVLRVGR